MFKTPEYQSKSKITRLENAKNYKLWKHKIILQLQVYELWDEDEEKKTPKPKSTAMALSFIFDHLSDTLQEQTIDKPTAPLLWTYLTSRFERTDVSSKTTAIQELVKFNYSAATMNENKAIHLDIKQSLTTAFGSESISVAELVNIFAVMNLPAQYHHLRTTLWEKSTSGTAKQEITLDQLYLSLNREESLMKSSNANRTVTEETTCEHGFNSIKCWKCHPCSKCTAANLPRTVHLENSKICRQQWANMKSSSTGRESYAATVGAKANHTAGVKPATSTGTKQESKAARTTTFNVDSGTTDSIVGNKEDVQFYSSTQHPIGVANNSSMIATEIGSMSGSKFSLKDVLVCSDVSENLLSVAQLADMGIDSIFTAEGVFLGKGATLSTTLCNGYRKAKSFYLDFPHATATTSANSSRASDSHQQDNLHLKLNHLNHQDITKLLSKNMVQDSETFEKPSNQPCEPCITGKAKRGTVPKQSSTRATRPGEKFHTDICGPMTPISNEGHRYVLTFTDDYSRYVIVFLLKNKSEAFEKFTVLDRVMYNQFSRHITTLRSDNGTEFHNNSFTDYCTVYGIQQEFSVVYRPHQNGISERLNLTVLNYMRATLKSSQLASNLWHEVLRNVCYTRNRSAVSAHPDKTPFEMFHGTKPSISHLQICGSICFAITTPWERRSAASFKLADRATKCTFVGYSNNKKAYRLLTSENKIIEVTFEDVTFPPTINQISKRDNEQMEDAVNATIGPDGERFVAGEESSSDEFASANDFSDTSDSAAESTTESLHEPLPVGNTVEPPSAIKAEPTPSDTESEINNTEMDTNQQTEIDAAQEEFPTLLPDPTGAPNVYYDPSRRSNISLQPITAKAPKDINDPPASSKRERKPPQYYTKSFAAVAQSTEELCMATTQDNLLASGLTWEKLPASFARSAQKSPLPHKYEDIEKLADRKEWIKATDAEIASLVEHKTWELVDLPPHRRALKNKWVFRIKRDSQGVITRYKARLCACGYSQLANIDYKDIYSPVVRSESFRMLLCLIASRNMEAHQMDVTTAFLNGQIEEDIYMRQPPGYESKACPNKVCKILQNLYGLKQAPRIWHQTIDPFLKSLGFTALNADPCLYFKYDENKLSLISLYVDDLAIASDSIEILNKIKQALSNRFKMTDEGELEYILGMKVTRKRSFNEMFLSSHQKTLDILKDFNMTNSLPVSTPMDHLTISTKDSPVVGSTEWLEMQNVPYRQCIGRLTHLMRTTRPDLAFSVSVVSRFLHNPGMKHWNAVKRILRYLNTTREYSLRLATKNLLTTVSAKDNQIHLVGNTDADWGGNVDTCKSTSGYSFFVGEGIISWGSKAQPQTATSSTHAEYIAAYHATAECLWLRNMLLEFQMIDASQATVLKCDNEAAIKIANYHMVTPRSKHFDPKFHFVREQVAEGNIALTFIPGKDNVADIFTKPLSKVKFSNFRAQLGLINDQGELNACQE